MTPTPAPPPETGVAEIRPEPCPFCGERLKLSTMKTSAGETRWWAHSNSLRGKCYAAPFMIEENDAEEIAEWNTRAALAAQPSRSPLREQVRALSTKWRQNAKQTHDAISKVSIGSKHHGVLIGEAATWYMAADALDALADKEAGQ